MCVSNGNMCFYFNLSALFSESLYAHINLRVKVMNIGPVEETVSSSNTELIYRKAMAIDETGNMSISFHGELTSVPNNNNIYDITHILSGSFNYERILNYTTYYNQTL